MTYEQALSKVRKEYPSWLIRTAWEFDGDYFFSVSLGDSFDVFDLSILIVAVNHFGKLTSMGAGIYEVTMFQGKSRSYVNDFREALRHDRPVDLTPEQYQELLNWRHKYAS